MRTFHRISATLAVLLCALGTIFAAHFAPPALAATPRSPAGGHVTIIVLDMSGSMSQNDPNGYRCSAANAYIDLSGPGDFIGVVGLDNTGATGGAHNFPTAQTWAQPTEMATVSERAALRATIQQKSNNCKPDGNTPTYDGLNQALSMLHSATQSGQVSGSVILLTDGVPYPSTSDQVNSIKSDLVPQFKKNGWPVDTIALGPPGAQNGVDFHGFLGDIASATAGKFYDDGKGIVPGVSPLNLAHFFVDIFALRNGRTPGSTIAPTNLSGGTTSRNFAVGNFVSHLDVIAVKDNPNTRVTVTAPNGRVISASNAGAFVSTDPHYVIFSIDNPQSGPWQLNVTGSGQFLMDSLVVSTLTLNITAPANGHAEPLGQPVTITAALRDQGNAVVGQQFDVKAVVSFVGNGTATPTEVLLTDPNGTGDYTGTISLPLANPTGTYEIAVTARSASENAVETQTTAQFEKFPTATLLSPTTGQPTDKLISTRVVQWDAVLRFVYASLPFYSQTFFGWHPSDWPLQGLAATPNALIDGEVLLGGTTYTSATVTATEVPANADGSCAITSSGTPVQVVNDGNGYFRLLFPTGAKGTFCVTLKTTGSYKDSFGDLTQSASPVAVTIGLPSLADELRAWAITTLYTLGLALLIALVYFTVNYVISPKPNGRAVLVDLGMQRIARSRSQLDVGRPLRWRGWSVRRFVRPNRLPGGEVTVPNNLLFIFRWGGEVQIKVRNGSRRDPGAQWQIDGRTITPADGPETIVDRTRLSYSEAGQKTDLQFEQGNSGANAASYSGTTGGGTDIRDRLGNAMDKLPGRGAARRD